jgi:hypothetical protein
MEVSTSLIAGGLTETYADGGEYRLATVGLTETHADGGESRPFHRRLNGDLC